jgi:hemerythrin-like domain-containing protein
MKPIGPLMWEHRLIERMVGLLDKELDRLAGRDGGVNTGFIRTAVDFFRFYADRTHHGKEEDILFKTLVAKKLSTEYRKTIDELIADHRRARELVGGLERAGSAYQRGDVDALGNITAAMRGLVTLYPKHIEKEDRHFFFPVLNYLTQEEQDAMLQEFWEFDRGMVHEKYRAVVEGLEGKPG